MNTSHLGKLIFAGTMLALGTGLAIPCLNAGPGPDYWRNLGQPKPDAAVVATPASMPTMAAACTDVRTVALTESKNDLANGRGPIRTVQVGTKIVCTSCAQPTVFMKPSWQNGRGPLQPVEIKGTHDCSTGCLVAKE